MLWVEPFHKVVGCLHGASGGQQVVVDEHHVFFFNGVFVDFDGVFPVFFHIAFLQSLGGKFSGFPAHDEPGSELDGQGCAQHESPGLYADHFCDAFVFVNLIELVEHNLHALGTFEECRHVLELYSRDGEVGNVSQIFQ